jgi:hypothetical protein
MTSDPRSRRALIVVVVAVVVAVLAALLLRSHTDASSPVGELPDSARAAVVPAPVTTSADPVGPSAHRHGVPVGWRHDTAGATAAATGYVRAIGLVATAGPLERPDIITTFATPSFGPSLTAKTDGQLDDLLFDLGAAGHTGADFTWCEYPLAVHTDDTSGDRIAVQVWSVSVVVVAGGSVARQVWHTDTLTLVWNDGDWKVDAWATTPGPTPGLGTEVDLSPVAAVEANTAWVSPISWGS